jgi:hypothetical protein
MAEAGFVTLAKNKITTLTISKQFSSGKVFKVQRLQFAVRR